MFVQGIPDGLSNMQRFERKREIVCCWLAEFGFSSLDVLSGILGQKSKDNALFFRRLFESGIIIRFKNISFQKKDLVRLGGAGWGFYCDSHEKKSALRSDFFVKHQRLLHDIAVQKCLVRMLHDTNEVHIKYDRDHEIFKGLNPDALLFLNTKDGRNDFAVAFEYELNKKDHRRIYEMFERYRKKLCDDLFKKVIFCFNTKADAALYRRLFDEEVWPTWSRKNNKEGKEYWSKDRRGRRVENDNFIRKCFIFECVPASSLPAIVKLKKSADRNLNSHIINFYDKSCVQNNEGIEEQDDEGIEEQDEEGIEEQDDDDTIC